MITSQRNSAVPDAPHSESLNDAAKVDDTAAAMPATPAPPRTDRRPKEKWATMKAKSAPNGADPAVGTAAASAPAVSKFERLLAHLRQPDGATITELMGATGWQAHSVRGAIAGALRKKGHRAVSEKTDGRERRYRLREAP